MNWGLKGAWKKKEDEVIFGHIKVEIMTDT